MKEEKDKLELRMYGLVNYNASPIQQGIQFGHAVVEYGLHHFKTELYQDWAKNWKTFIILNGGSTNNNHWRPGSMQTHLNAFKEAKITLAEFYEPDMNDALTSFVFIVDERVFNREKYPDYNYMSPNRLPSDVIGFSMDRANAIQQDEDYARKAWVKSIGGEKNAFLREYLRQFRLA